MIKLSEPMVRALRLMVEGRSPLDGLHGQSEHGGWHSGTRPALMRRGLMTADCQITDVGRIALTAHARAENMKPQCRHRGAGWVSEQFRGMYWDCKACWSIQRRKELARSERKAPR